MRVKSVTGSCSEEKSVIAQSTKGCGTSKKKKESLVGVPVYSLFMLAALSRICVWFWRCSGLLVGPVDMVYGGGVSLLLVTFDL